MRIAQKPFNQFSDEENQKFHDRISKYFSSEWLERNDNNPVQTLWHRKDYLASLELYILSEALRKFSNEGKWLDEIIENIKSDDMNNRNGSLFELIGLSFYKSGSNTVKPLGNKSPGIDALLNFKKGESIGISCKRYGISKHNETFLSASEKIKEQLILHIKESKINQLKLFISFEEKYPEIKDWEKLLEILQTHIYPRSISERNFHMISDNWMVYCTNVTDYEKVQPNWVSYELIILTHYHKNEEKNLFDKIDEACANIINKGLPETEYHKNFLYLKLPITASLINNISLLRNYFKDNPNSPLSGAVLYQPSFVIGDKDFLYHCINVVDNPSYHIWLQKHPHCKLSFAIPTQHFGHQPEKKILLLNVNGEHREYSIDNFYIYQRGNINYKTEWKDGSVSFEPKMLGSGIFTNYVIDYPPDIPYSAPHSFGTHFPPSIDLLIL